MQFGKFSSLPNQSVFQVVHCRMATGLTNKHQIKHESPGWDKHSSLLPTLGIGQIHYRLMFGNNTRAFQSGATNCTQPCTHLLYQGGSNKYTNLKYSSVNNHLHLSLSFQGIQRLTITNTLRLSIYTSMNTFIDSNLERLRSKTFQT